MTREVRGGAVKIGPLNPQRVALCPRTQGWCVCGKHSGVKIFPRSRLRTARMWSRENGGLKCLPPCLQKRISSCTCLKSEIWGQQERNAACASTAATSQGRQWSRGHAFYSAH